MSSHRPLLSAELGSSSDDVDDHGDTDLEEFSVADERTQQPTNGRFCKGFGIMAGVSTVVGLFVFLIAHQLFVSISGQKDYTKEKETAYWHKLAGEELRKSLDIQPNLGRAKNVIMFIGDGMGPTSVTAGRILAGQMGNLKGEDHRLSFDKFPHTGLAVTYSVDTQITDSAASATAYTSGVKTNQGILGMNAKAQFGNCSSSKGTEVDSILRWFLDSGRAGGVVTTTTVTHATPGATYCHSPSRKWEVDTALTQEAIDGKCKDIALQLIEDNDDINVIMGGGMTYFKPLNYVHPHPDTDPWFKNKTKGRNDNRDLTREWQGKKKDKKHKFVSTKEELDNVDARTIDYLFGLFTEFNMAYEIDRNSKLEPSLAEMTKKAIQVLKRNEKGFFLMVEGGRIDHGHHETKPSKALHDVIALSKAVEKALEMTDKSETLILVTADHSHTMSIAGYAPRGNPILEKSIYSEDQDHAPKDHKPYTTLLYADGPGYAEIRQNISLVDTTDKDYISQSAVPMWIETHGGEDVAMYAQGPQAHLYSGVHENTYIPMLMAYAACVGPYKEDCASSKYNTGPALQVPHLTVFISLLLLIEFTRRH